MGELRKWKRLSLQKNFIKLHGQKTASLLEARIVDLKDMSDDDFQHLTEYDCKAIDGSYYPLKKNNQYCLLVFLGDKNIPFSTLRNIQKYEYYKNKIKTIFEVVVENDG